MPKTQPPGQAGKSPPGMSPRSRDQTAGKKGKKGGLIGLVKRKPLEAIGAAAAIAGIIFFLVHKGSSSSSDPASPSYLAPAGDGPPAGGNGGYQLQIDRLQRQLDALEQRRHPHPHHKPPPPGGHHRPPRRRHQGIREHGGNPPRGHRRPRGL